jgi:hypothetical protein
MLEASLCVAETHRSLQSGKIDYTTVGLYKRNAMQIIGERLNDPRLSITDGTLHAVLTLAYSEVSWLICTIHSIKRGSSP